MCKLIPPSLFFGGLLILAGILFIVKNYVSFRIPVFSILFALFLIWLGICLLVRSPESARIAAGGERSSISFRDERLSFDGREIKNGSYEVAFGQYIVDMKGSKVAKAGATIRFSATFGNMEVKLAKDMPVRITGSVTFGNIVAVDKQSSGIDGKFVYESPSYKGSSARLDIIADCTFGNLRIE
ncbi:MAG: LiaF domain-containing protein [Spirochaetota bacterium]